jgi:hypothetical protein
MLCPKPVFQQASGAKRARKGKVRLVRNKLKQCVVQINAAVVVLRTQQFVCLVFLPALLSVLFLSGLLVGQPPAVS